MIEHVGRRKRPETDRSLYPCDDFGDQPPSGCASTRVMVVEDDIPTGRILVRLLVASGFEATHVEDHRTAVKQACTWLPDVLITDIDLHAERNGCDVLKTMRQAYPGLRAISISGLNADTAVPASHAAGFDAHLSKPFAYDQLVQTIRQVLSARRKALRPIPNP